jgi:hypothetical protein
MKKPTTTMHKYYATCLGFVLLLVSFSTDIHATSIPCNGATSQSVSNSCSGCTVTNPGNAVDNNTSSYSTIHFVQGEIGYVGQRLIYPTTGNVGDSIMVVLSTNTNINDTGYLSNITVGTYLGNNFNNDRISINSSEVSLKLTHGIGKFPHLLLYYAYVRFAATQTFDRVEVQIGSGKDKITDFNIHYSYYHIPMPTVLASVIQFCPGQSVTIKALAPVGATFKWYDQPSEGNVVYTGSSHTFPHGPIQTESLYVEASKNGCVNSNRVEVKMVEVDDPNPPIVEGQYICKGYHATLTANSPGATVRWYSSSNSASSIAQGDTLITPALNSNTIYYTDAINSIGCISYNPRIPVEASILSSAQPVLKYSSGLSHRVVATLPTSSGGLYAGFTKVDYGLMRIDHNGKYLWQKLYGGSQEDHMVKIIPAVDGGFILAGSSKSNNGDVSFGNNGGYDFWIVKVDSNGTKIWDKTFGGSKDDNVTDIIPTNDNGYIISGTSYSKDGDITDGNNGGSDYLVIKINKNGSLQWLKTFGGTKDDLLLKAIITEDGGYLAAGTTTSSNGDVLGHHAKEDFWVVKINSSGHKVWTKCLGGSESDYFKDVYLSPDGGFILGGLTISSNGDVTGYHGDGDFWAIKINSHGDKVWSRAIGGSQDEWGFAMTKATDGGYILSGTSYSNDGDIHNAHGFNDICLFKFNEDGNLLWSKPYGGEFFEEQYLLTPTSDGGYVIGGLTRSQGGQLSMITHGDTDFFDLWIVKIDVNGKIIWDGTYGSNFDDGINTILPNSNGDVWVSAYFSSIDGDVVINDSIVSPVNWIFKLGKGSPCFRKESIGLMEPSYQDVDTLFPKIAMSYSNPFSHKLLLLLDMRHKAIAKVQLFNEQGKMVINTKRKIKKGIQKLVINTKKLKPGNYTVHLLKDNKVVELKLRKQ